MAESAGGAAAIEDVFPLTGLQEGMFAEYQAYLDDMSGTSTVPPYNEQFVCTLEGRLDPVLFEGAWNDLATRHPMLRTAFTAAPGKGLVQVVLVNRPISFAFADILGCADIEKFWMVRAYDERRKVFDLARDTLVRVCLLRTGEARYRLIVTFHHLIADAWCGPVLVADLMAIYAKAIGHDDPLSPPPRSRFSDFSRSQAKQRGAANAAFWLDYLDGMDELAPLPFRDKGAAPGEFDQAAHVLPPVTVRAMAALARHLEIPVSAILHAIWGWVLARLTDRDDVLFATVRANRPADLPDIERVIGMFIATVPLRVNLTRVDSLGALFQQVHRDLQATAIWSAAPLTETLAAGGLSASQIDHTMIGRNDLLAGGDETSLEFPRAGLSLTEFHAESWDHYDFQIGFSHGQETRFEAKFRCDRFNPADVARLLAIMVDALEVAVWMPDADPKSVRIFNDVSLAGSFLVGPVTTKPDLMPAAIEAALAACGEKTVTVDDNEILSGTELVRSVVATARLLANVYGIQSSDNVAILAAPGNDIIIGILAVWRLGATFVPVGADWPARRIAFCLADCSAKLILAPQSWNPGTEVVCPRFAVGRFGVDADIAAPPPVLPDIAYIIYTSGSTGEPKGVRVGMDALSNYCDHAIKTFGLGPDDAALQVSSPAFDLGYTTLFPLLLAGGTLNWIDHDRLVDPLEVVESMAVRRVTVLKCTPSYLRLMLSTPRLDELSRLTDWRLLVLGGEGFDGGDLDLLGTYCPWLRVVNHYGPTEATIGCAMAALGDVMTASRLGKQIIGTPVANSRAFIRDRNGSDLPRGAIGELVVEGAALARGYVDGAPGGFYQNGVKRYYRSGDRARITGDGFLEYLGRADDMVKIRGFRVSPMETEAAIRQLPEIDDVAVVVDRRDGDDRVSLLAFVQTSLGELQPADLRLRLAANLLPAQIPSRFQFVSRLVINENGKIDRAAMLRHSVAPDSEITAGTGPSTATERRLAKIWARVLKVDTVAATDDFFALGGHSLRALEVGAEVRREFNEILSVKTFFAHPVLSDLARRIDLGAISEGAVIPLRRHADGARMLCMPPALGTASLYKALVDTMALDIGVDGVDCPDMDVSVPTLEALVEQMLRGLPDGGSGYDCLLGWSFGASLAIEMARRLEQRGQAVKLLLLDGMPCQIADPAISGEFEGFEVLAQRRYWSGVMNTLRRTMTDDQIVGLERMAGRNKSLWENYKVCVPINADILAVEARRPKSATKGMAGLAQITHGKVRVVPTSGDHYSMFHPPHLHEWIVEAKIFLSGE